MSIFHSGESRLSPELVDAQRKCSREAQGTSNGVYDEHGRKPVLTDAHALENGAAVLPSEGEYSGGSKTEFLPYNASNSLSSRSSMR